MRKFLKAMGKPLPVNLGEEIRQMIFQRRVLRTPPLHAPEARRGSPKSAIYSPITGRACGILL